VAILTFYAYLNTATDGDEWSAARHGRVTPGTHSAHFLGVWVGHGRCGQFGNKEVCVCHYLQLLKLFEQATAFSSPFSVRWFFVYYKEISFFVNTVIC